MMRKNYQPGILALLLSGALALAASRAQAAVADFGRIVEEFLHENSSFFFGVGDPLEEAAPPTEGPYRMPGQPAEDQVALAGGLEAHYLTRRAANDADMIQFWPPNDPTQVIICVEGNPSRQEASTLCKSLVRPPRRSTGRVVRLETLHGFRWAPPPHGGTRTRKGRRATTVPRTAMSIPPTSIG